jgi:predicted Zn-dependent peptidase
MPKKMASGNGKTKLKETYRKTVLKNGLRVVSESVHTVRSISIGVWIDVGSRDESSHEGGASHFIEHMLFKGTKKRSAKEIASALESVGGSLNAFTGREHTCYFARVLDEHLDIALDVLSDIIRNPLFNQQHLEKERQVILSEIKELEDSPSEMVHDLLMSSMWKQSPLGKPIIGSTQSVLRMSKGKLVDFMKNNYTFSRVVIAASGNVEHKSLVSKVARKFKLNPDPRPNLVNNVIPQAEGNRRVVKKKTAQTHISLGIPAFPYKDERRYAGLLLSNILGGGMSSRLFQNIREKLGLVYSIYSFFDFFEDVGLLSIYMGTDKENTPRVIEKVLKETKRLKKNSITSQELSNAKYQLKGNLLMSLESTFNRMNRLARYELFLHDYVDLDQTIRAINKIKATDLIQVAEELFSTGSLSAVALGPLGRGALNGINWDNF